MKLDAQSAAYHLEEVIARAEAVVKRQDADTNDWTVQEVMEAYVSLAHALRRCCPPGSFHAERANSIIGEGEAECRLMLYQIELMLGVAKALFRDWTLDRLQTFREMVHADLFSDMLDAASYLLAEGYKDAAAVTAGGVLEEHVRKLCEKHSVPTVAADKQNESLPRRVNALIADLGAKGVYDKNIQKQLVWLTGIRNAAAHAEYASYDEKTVELMIQGIRNFVADCPA